MFVNNNDLPTPERDELAGWLSHLALIVLPEEHRELMGVSLDPQLVHRLRALAEAIEPFAGDTEALVGLVRLLALLYYPPTSG